MSTTPENPNAFPSPDTYHPNGQVEYGAPGMTLRDYFAGQALAIIASGDIDHEEGWPDYARCAYKAADAMLRAREQK